MKVTQKHIEIEISPVGGASAIDCYIGSVLCDIRDSLEKIAGVAEKWEAAVGHPIIYYEPEYQPKGALK